ncbi:putative thiopurine S-methyltransferase [Holothuria leucospilota]|uniref:thiopurine S-methyltransferase n=1 Tax=Holothuria leucospilota TaxID=206669 RepID=A0A9Q1HFC8_HOLLE|nr:putative thiopurine S-methyltransferase [Holothuria leucospilota]
MADSYDTQNDRMAEWEDRWQNGRIAFHRDNVNQNLLNNFERLANGRKELNFLVPLCGKTVDMKWLAGKGFEVTGIEGVTKACEEFFSEQDVKCNVSDIPDVPSGKLFKSEDGKIKIYNCDIFSLSSETLGQFDVIWDRGSLVAILAEDRQRYLGLMKSVIKPGGKILLEVVEYDWNERKTKGPPRPFFKHNLEDLYGNWCAIEEVGRYDWLHRDLARFQGQWGLSSLDNVQYFMQVISSTSS